MIHINVILDIYGLPSVTSYEEEEHPQEPVIFYEDVDHTG